MITRIKHHNEDAFDALVVCTHHHEPRYPDYPGDFFQGILTFIKYHKTSKPFADKRVLVIGGEIHFCDVGKETKELQKKSPPSARYHPIPKIHVQAYSQIYFLTKVDGCLYVPEYLLRS